MIPINNPTNFESVAIKELRADEAAKQVPKPLAIPELRHGNEVGRSFAFACGTGNMWLARGRQELFAT